MDKQVPWDYRRGVHLPLLMEWAVQGTGPILEIIGGDAPVFSTPCLESICRLHNRILKTIREGDPLPEHNQWDLVLLDVEDALQYLSHFDGAGVIIVANSLKYDLQAFRYVRSYAWLLPESAVVSNTINVKTRKTCQKC